MLELIAIGSILERRSMCWCVYLVQRVKTLFDNAYMDTWCRTTCPSGRTAGAYDVYKKQAFVKTSCREMLGLKLLALDWMTDVVKITMLFLTLFLQRA